MPSALARGTNCAVWAPHYQLGFVCIYVVIVRSRSGMQLPFNVNARAHAVDLGTGRRTSDRRNAFVLVQFPLRHSLSLTTSTTRQCTTKRSHLLQPLHVHALKLPGNDASHVPSFPDFLARGMSLRILHNS